MKRVILVLLLSFCFASEHTFKLYNMSVAGNTYTACTGAGVDILIAPMAYRSRIDATTGFSFMTSSKIKIISSAYGKIRYYITDTVYASGKLSYNIIDYTKNTPRPDTCPGFGFSLGMKQGDMDLEILSEVIDTRTSDFSKYQLHNISISMGWRFI